MWQIQAIPTPFLWQPAETPGAPSKVVIGGEAEGEVIGGEEGEVLGAE